MEKMKKELQSQVRDAQLAIRGWKNHRKLSKERLSQKLDAKANDHAASYAYIDSSSRRVLMGIVVLS